MWIYRNLIIAAAQRDLAAQLCAVLAGPGGSNMFTTPLSPTGLEPATHYISAGMIEDRFLQRIDRPYGQLHRAALLVRVSPETQTQLLTRAAEIHQADQQLRSEEVHRKGWTISSYRTHSGVEVDLVIATGEQIVAIECKSGRQGREAALRGLRSFEAGIEAPVRKYVVYRGERRQVFSHGELAVPWMEFLLEELPRL